MFLNVEALIADTRFLRTTAWPELQSNNHCDHGDYSPVTGLQRIPLCDLIGIQSRGRNLKLGITETLTTVLSITFLSHALKYNLACNTLYR